MKPVLRIAAAQLCSKALVRDNLNQCLSLAEEAASWNADLLVFPENTPFMGGGEERPSIAESMDGEIVSTFREMAQTHQMAVSFGFHETSQEETRSYNTSVFLNARGELVQAYRKIHLFDADLPNGKTLRESSSFVPGPMKPTMASWNGWDFGMTICYDLRFPELYRNLRQAGAQVLFVPSAFTARTGRDHWEVLLRARAIENQCYVVAPNQWGIHAPGRESYGRTMIIDPWGTVLSTVHDGPGIAVADIEMKRVEALRQKMPCLSHARLLET